MLAKLDVLSQIVEGMDNPAFFHDSQFRIIFVNSAYCQHAGVEEGEALGKHYWEVFPKGSGPLPNCNLTTHLHDGKNSLDQFSIGDKEFLSNGFSAIDPDSNTPIFFHVFTDITKSINAVRALGAIENQFKVLFQLSPDAIMLLDEKSFLDCNPATLAMFGCPLSSDFLGKHPSQFSPDVQPNGISSAILANQRINEALSNGSCLFEWTHCKLDGTEFPAEVLLVSFTRDGKRILQATVRDIANRKEAERKLAQESEKLQKAFTDTIQALIKSMELRDPYTAGHQERVARIACSIAKELGWDEHQIDGLRMAGLVHDIGKIAVPAEILTKPSALSEFEEKIVREHSEHGYELLKDIEFPHPVARIVRQHHERLDGSGYPFGLRGDQILPEAKLLGIADSIEAMASHRPYRAARGLSFAIEQIKSEADKQFDGQMVAVAVKLFEGKADLEEALQSLEV
ncbi:HD domain-containing protein [Polynucleobacter sp. 71A-WALBACH]|uniref:HD domain-containing phosphohydrolase n=1 Tax=Polynucleobacter sp. 71A-WALBACH TaxID=2689097 RepID=UPI001C0D64DD|nr:HD domain-containing phosphohydrolase [Polynucleobacter sp. 71A-WALBACH]MBU3594776.1 HD domain-containing protein [Polynucleobacter sp. 71A-WALBACH]